MTPGLPSLWLLEPFRVSLDPGMWCREWSTAHKMQRALEPRGATTVGRRSTPPEERHEACRPLDLELVREAREIKWELHTKASVKVKAARGKTHEVVQRHRLKRAEED